MFALVGGRLGRIPFEARFAYAKNVCTLYVLRNGRLSDALGGPRPSGVPRRSGPSAACAGYPPRRPGGS
jgi:hypothetical protein